EYVQLVDPVRAQNIACGQCVKCENPLRPCHEPDHFRPVKMLHGNHNRRQAKSELEPQKQYDRRVGKIGIGAYPRIKQAAMRVQGHTYKRDVTCYTTHCDCRNLIERMADTHTVEKLDRGQQPDEMTAKNDKNTNMKQNRSSH